MKYLYTDGKFLPVGSNNASTMMQAFNYGTAAFEGMKAFWHPQEKNWFIFRPRDHFARISESVKWLDLDLKLTESQFIKAISELIRRNNVKSSVYIRPLIYRNAKGAGITKESGYGFSIFLGASPIHSAKDLKCCLVSQRRPTDGSYNVKLAGNYMLSFVAIREAKQRGFDQAILLATNGYVSEASVMNLFFAKGGRLYTPSLDCGPLAGITRRTIMQLAKEQIGVKVSEGKYRAQRLLDADEVFFTGTGSGVNFCKQIERKRYSLKRKDRLAPQLWQLYQDLTAGKLPQYSDWLVPVK